MCGWPVLAVSEPDSPDFLHFAAQGPDGLAWDALGPRSFDQAGAAYAETPCWEGIDPYRFVATASDVDETAITRACRDAMIILGPQLMPHVLRQPR